MMHTFIRLTNMATLLITVTLLVNAASCSNSTTPDGEDSCESPAGLWSLALEDWATSTRVHSDRHGRVMALPTTKGYYVTDRFDSPYLAHPPPGPSQNVPPKVHIPQPPHHQPGPGYIPQPGAPHGLPPPPGHGIHVPQGYKEWEGAPSSPGKIVNRPPKPYKDKFKPSYPPPVQPEHRPGSPNSIDRVDDPPRKQVTETDLYLLSAIEKLVYRVDLMEKRLRKMEESVHYLIAGAESKADPCPKNYTRVGSACYEWSAEALDWKGASVACRKNRAALLELTDEAQRKIFYSKLLSDKTLRGEDFWTGGLNPGLLWIWSHSARPVEPNATNSTGVAGDGRCLALVSDPTRATYVYRGQDCAVRHRYVCQKEEESLSNEIERVAKALKADSVRKSKLLWGDDLGR